MQVSLKCSSWTSSSQLNPASQNNTSNHSSVVAEFVSVSMCYYTLWNTIKFREFSFLTLRRLMSYIYMEHPFLMFLDHAQRCSTVGRTPLDEWSARRRDLYLTTHDTHNRQISMPRWDLNPHLSRWAACGRSPAEIVGSNPTGGMDICLLWVSCVVR